jgi:hypothetical protein
VTQSRNTVVGDVTHKGSGNRWDCGRCGKLWPCETAREELIASFGGDRVSLAVYMATDLVRAARDLSESTPAELYVRFIAWTR